MPDGASSTSSGRRRTSSGSRARTGSTCRASRSGSSACRYTERRARRRAARAARSCCCASSAPEYEIDGDRGDRALADRDGLLVAARGRGGDGYLEIDVRRCRGDEARLGARPRRGRGRELLPGDRDVARALVLREHAVADPRARHARLPALARAARARGVGGRALRRAAGCAGNDAADHVGETPWGWIAAARRRGAAAVRRRCLAEPALAAGAVSARSFARSWRT